MRKSLIAAALTIGTLIAPAAQAALVTEWDWTVTSVWNTTTQPPTFTSGTDNRIVTSSEISWGAAGGDYTNTLATPDNARSAVVISDSPAGSLPTMVTNSLVPVATNTFTHYNNAISSSFATLQTARLDTTLSLTPNTPPGPVPAGFPQTISFSIRFIETLNQPTCFTGSVSTCDDIFVIELGNLSQHFSYQDFNYQIDIVSLLGGFLGLSPAACAAAGASAGCVGFQTQEGEANVERLGLLISTVPEPGVLALMGIGLLGLAATRRRRMI